MNLLLINYEYPPVGGGAATATQAMARALLTLGHTPHVLTARYRELRGLTTEDGVHVHRIAALRSRAEASTIVEMASFLACGSLQVRALCRRHGIDGIISFFSFPCGPVAWWSGRPYVVSLRGGDVPGAEPNLAAMHRLLAPLRRRVLRSACAVVANSEGLRALSARADPVPVRVIPNGVDSTFFRPPASRPPTSDPFRWLFVGRFQPQKNLAWMLRQFATLRAGAPPPFTLDLIGDGPQRAELQQLAADLGLADIVRWHGWKERPKLLAIYQEADALVNPSLYEGMPNVVLEAMACGLPVLASRVAGNDAVVQDGVTGRLFALGDAPAFQAALLAWLANPITTKRLGVNAREITEREFSWIGTARSYLELFQSSDSIPRAPVL